MTGACCIVPNFKEDNMKRRISAIAAVFAFLTPLGVWARPQAGKVKTADSRAADGKAVRTAAADWWKTGVVKNAEKFSSYYAPDASLFPPGSARINGQKAILEHWKKFFATPGLAIKGATDGVEASRSGDLAMETGTFELTTNDAKGKPVTQKGKYVVVWKKQADGAWKAYRDIFNMDL